MLLIGVVLAAVGISILIWNKPLSEKLGAFYARRYVATFGNIAHYLGLDNSSSAFNRFMFRGFVITAGIILLIFAIAAFLGTNFVGLSISPSTSTILHQSP